MRRCAYARHGGDIYSFQKQEKPLLDFSANINPLGVPDVLRSAIVNVVDFLVHYPDPAQRRLRQALAEFHGKTPEQIVCGNGGADVIFRTVRAVLAEPRTDSRAGIFGICGGAC